MKTQLLTYVLILSMAIGVSIASAGTEGTNYTYYGLGAGNSNSGFMNTFVGKDAGYSNTTDTANTFIGHSAGYHNDGSANTFVGKDSGYHNTTGYWNTFLGFYSGYGNTTGYKNTFIGMHAGGEDVYESSTGSENIFIGYVAGKNNLTGDQNTFVGNNAGWNLTEGDGNVFLGYYAGYRNTASYNVFLGYQAGYSNTVGDGNVFLGYNAGYSNTASNNTFIGYQAGDSNNTGYSNTFLGRNAGASNTTGAENTILGDLAGNNNTAGNQNTFLGKNAGNQNTIGAFNTFIGKNAGRDNTEGYSNTFLGLEAGQTNTTGGLNTFIGNRAGYSNSTGGGNVFLGGNAGYNETGSNKLYIDNSSTSSPLIYGDFYNDIVTINGSIGIGTTMPTSIMEVARDQLVPRILATGYRDAYSAGDFTGRKARGSMASKEAVQEDDVLAAFGGYGYAPGGWPTGPTAVKGRMQIVAAENWTDTTQGAYINFLTTEKGVPATRTERMRITDAGNVGIGTTDPASKLTVAGTIESTSGGIKFPDASTLASANTINADTVDGLHASAFALSAHLHSGADITSGTVGEAYIDALIARDSEIMPTVLANDGSASTLDADLLDGQDSSAFMSAATDNWVNTTGDTMTGNLLVYGDVDIDQDLYVVGNLYLESDVNAKKNIMPIELSLEKISNIKGVSFAWKDEKKDSGVKHYGVIAQQVEEVLPEIVKKGDDGIRKVAYMELIPVLIEAIKEQQDIVEGQNNTISKLKEQNKQISERLAEIEKELKLKDSMAMADIHQSH